MIYSIIFAECTVSSAEAKIPSGSLTASPVRFLPKSMPIILSISAKLAIKQEKKMSNNNKQPRQPRVRKYRLTLADDQTHRQIKVAKFSRWSFFLTVAVVFVTISVCLMMLIALTPLKSFIPGYPDADTRKASVQNAIQIDSLRNVVSKW